MSSQHAHSHSGSDHNHTEDHEHPPRTPGPGQDGEEARAESTIPPGAKEAKFRVSGMDCSEEVAAIENAFKGKSAVAAVRANLIQSSVSIYHDGSLSDEELVRTINSSGVKVQPSTGKAESAGLDRRALLVGISGASTGLGLLLGRFLAEGSWFPEIAFFAAILSGGALIFPKAFRSLRTFSLDMNVLMTVAVIGAIAINEHAEGAAVVFLFALSELLESWSVGRARRAIQALMQLSPEVALVRRDGKVIEVPAAEVRLEETVVIKSGERIPLDGEVLSGNSAVNQAPITGESMPVEKKQGDIVYAGTINGEGTLDVKVTKAASESTLSRIIQMVELAQEQKAPAQRFVDIFAKYYTPSVIVVAILVTLIPPLLLGLPWGDWIYRGLVLLVIACPCALVISTPVSVVSGLTAMARRGVLIKGGAYLEALGKLKALALDKTGTITQGKPRVVEVVRIGDLPDSEIVRAAAAIDTHSTHPLAQAVVQYAEEQGIQFPQSTNYRNKTGRGAEAEIDGHPFFVGNHRYAHELGVCTPEIELKLAAIEEQARSVVIVGHQPHPGCENGKILGILAVADTIRDGVPEAIKAMHEAGLEQVIMLSGDNPKTARAIANEAGIDEAHGDLLPDDKITKIKELAAKYGSVGMIGDGVNDAPALATADIGFAMGMAGTDTAIETADVTLMRDDLAMVSLAVKLGRRTLAMIRFNIGFALAAKAIFLVLAVFGVTSLWLAILADTGATILVILNALRLLHNQEPQTTPSK
jgi:Cd2+/Zn2+-exporting ATPase